MREMKPFATLAERAVLDKVEPEFWADGYRLVREPGPSDLPPFLAELPFRLDAIAVGREPSLVVEVLRKEGGVRTGKIKKLRSLLESQKNWELYLLYFSSIDPVLETVPRATAAEAVEAARKVAGVDPRAAVLFAWSIIEAAARDRIEAAGSAPLHPRALAGLLAEEGYVDQEQGLRMFDLSNTRNRVAHGQIDVIPSPEDVDLALDVAERVARA